MAFVKPGSLIASWARVLGTCSLLAWLALPASAGIVTQISVLKNAPDEQGTSPTIVGYPSIATFTANTSGSNTVRGIGQNASCDVSTTVNGVVYYLGGSATSTDTKYLSMWPSFADWAANTNTQLIAQRDNDGGVSGMSVSNGELYVLEGSASAGGNKTLRKWSTLADFASGAGTVVGTRALAEGIGFEIAPDGTVYQLAANTAYTATSGILYQWPTLADYQADSNVTSTNLTFFSGSPDQIAGLAVVPEPLPLSLIASGGLLGWMCLRRGRCRRR